MFTSPLLAADYLRAFAQQGQVAGVAFDSIAESFRLAREDGAHSFSLNRCPRCPELLTHPLEAIGSLDMFLKIWSIECATRFHKGQLYARAVLAGQAQGLDPMKKALEMLRDHAAADNPYVYQLLALIARLQSDVEGRTTALTRLKEFQPPVTLETDDFARGLAEGTIGLLASFELLRIPGAVPS